ncbi:phospholipase B-like 1 [Myxocyprinus asiaticus]|uniref:phospholipase B-like 1 n=1 Tax=Myxocyprinus asiaticus TaxID=70543 RepID=UPI00222365A4|nr:phospholipase B-like 1 [Myxocyprinus asiaticus]
MYRFTQGLILFLLLPATFVKAQQIQRATVFWDAVQRSVVLKENVMEEGGDAFGYFNDSLTVSGWGVLELRAGYGKLQENDEISYFLAGYLEGFLTASQMINHYFNMYPQLIRNHSIMKPLKRFMSEQDSWTRAQVKLYGKSDTSWHHVGLLVAQLDGLHAGVAYWAKSRQEEPLSMFAVQFLNGIGDLLDLIPVLKRRSNSSSDSFRMPGMGHCSALIKMLPGYENLLLGHSSWYTYAASMRIYKHWDFSLKNKHNASSRLSFSSYPGILSSLDDFYLLGTGLFVTQTTNNVFNSSLFSLVTPEALFAWQRVRVAHALARTGKQWAQIFSKHNSGTYNNQYMVVDLKRVSLGKKIDNWSLTIVEQIPGLVVYSDQSQALRHGYWASYNIPFHSDIYRKSGYAVMWKKYGEDFSYDLCPRAKIFRRDQAKITNLDTLKNIMRYNDYRKDPYSKKHPCKSICCRNDLRLRRPHPGGCYDTKVTDHHMAQMFTVEAVNGPTTQNALPPFSWSHFNRTAHQGLPQTYNFTFITMQPLLSSYIEQAKRSSQDC